MKPVWNNYKDWEDYKKGMFKPRKDKNIAELCFDLFRCDDLHNKMSEAVNKWSVSAQTNLSKKVFNRNPWVGQATCCYHLGATCDETTMAWILLTKEERNRANEIAREVISEWENENI